MSHTHTHVYIYIYIYIYIHISLYTALPVQCLKIPHYLYICNCNDENYMNFHGRICTNYVQYDLSYFFYKCRCLVFISIAYL